jgi:hypothetical protein
MSTVAISMIGDTAARIEFTVCKFGKSIMAGGAKKVSVIIEDSEHVRLALANLTHLKTHDFMGPIRMRFNDLHTYVMDSTVWRDLCDALLAFVLNIDLQKMLA